MMVLREMRRRAKALVGPVLGMALTGYFAYHLVEGDRGLLAWARLTKELRLANEDYTAVDTERAALDHRVANLRSDHVDPDLLDAQARKNLDVVAPGEIVIMTPAGKP
ncbi:MAG TPA: septum formation initiator family protein [Stellaceae bacterium]|jgi:cell division protein FtsB|nr:septum formation initiator family protein [Stellaceae bacterium]